MSKVLDTLDNSKGGIPETGRVNKNREFLICFDRKKHTRDNLSVWLENAITNLINDNIDCVIITVKERTW